MTREEMLRRAVAVLNAPKGTVNAKVCFLTARGCDGTLIMEALNIASGGEVVRSALGETSRRSRRPRRRFIGRNAAK